MPSFKEKFCPKKGVCVLGLFHQPLPLEKHWSLSSAHGNEIADDSFLWRGKVEGDGVDMDTNTISLQGAGHVTLGRFDDSCPGNPTMCEDGFTVSFWMKYGGKVASKWSKG